MKKIGFIGAYDKTDLMLYIAKMLKSMDKTVIVIDTTAMQKAKYVVPAIRPTKTYFTDYEGIDVAVGFESKEHIDGYLGLAEDEELNYDYVLIDIDSSDVFESFNMENADLNYFVTSFDLYSLKKGLEALSGIQNMVKVTKVLYSKEMSNEENEYLDFLSSNYNIEWNELVIHFSLNESDQNAIMENQRAAKIKTKNLSTSYRDNLIVIVSQICNTDNINELKKVLKNIDKGV